MTDMATTHICWVKCGLDIGTALIGLNDEFATTVSTQVEVPEALERLFQIGRHHAVTALN